MMTLQKEIEVDALTIDRRVRNRIIENLEIISSIDNWNRVCANEIVNLWYDFVPGYSVESFPLETYTQEEQDAIRCVCDALERLATSTPNELPALELLVHEPAWDSVVRSGKKALATLLIRGPFAEDV